MCFGWFVCLTAFGSQSTSRVFFQTYFRITLYKNFLYLYEIFIDSCIVIYGFFYFFYFKLQNYELNQSNFVEMPSVRIQEIEIRWMARGNQQSIQHLEQLEYQQKKKNGLGTIITIKRTFHVKKE
jgi:hypothetical protein